MFKPSLAALGHASPGCHVDREVAQRTHGRCSSPPRDRGDGKAAVGQGVECGLGAAVPARAAKAAAGQPWRALGWGGSGEEGARAQGSATHHLAPHRHSNTSLFINSNYFPFPFIMINTWRLCWIKYWLPLNIFINTYTHISLSRIYM